MRTKNITTKFFLFFFVNSLNSKLKTFDKNKFLYKHYNIIAKNRCIN